MGPESSAPPSSPFPSWRPQASAACLHSASVTSARRSSHSGPGLKPQLPLGGLAQASHWHNHRKGALGLPFCWEQVGQRCPCSSRPAHSPVGGPAPLPSSGACPKTRVFTESLEASLQVRAVGLAPGQHRGASEPRLLQVGALRSSGVQLGCPPSSGWRGGHL